MRKPVTDVEQSPDTIVITDTEENIKYVNPGLIRNTGYPVEEVLGKNSSLVWN